MTRSRVWSEFVAAASEAKESNEELHHLAVSYMARFVEEFPSFGDEPGGRDRKWLASASLGVSYAPGEGDLTTGKLADGGIWVEPRPLATAPASLATSLTLGLGRPAAAHVDGAWTGEDLELRDSHLVVARGALGGWVGRRSVALGPGAGGGLILNGTHPFTGIGFFSARPFELPSVLEALGKISFETFLSRVAENGQFRSPWFWAARTSLTPHPRVGLGATRGAMLGGEGNVPVEPLDVLYLVVGKHGSGGSRVDNQLAALDLWFRPPLGSLPLLMYLEWGMEDSAGAWKDVPGVVAGAYLSAVPGVPAMSVSLEHASFAGSCCGNPTWYRHWAFLEGWSVDGSLLGHPLGGHGRQWSAGLHLDLQDARLRADGNVFWRLRHHENVYGPTWEGVSRGGGVSASYRWTAPVEISAGFEVEVGETGWRRWSAEVGVSAFLQ